MLKKIRERILKISGVESYATNNNIRVATVYDFLNGKVDVRFSTLMKIIEPLGLDICDKIPKKIYETDCINSYDEKKVVICFGDESTLYQAVVLEAGFGKFELVIIGVD